MKRTISVDTYMLMQAVIAAVGGHDSHARARVENMLGLNEMTVEDDERSGREDDMDYKSLYEELKVQCNTVRGEYSLLKDKQDREQKAYEEHKRKGYDLLVEKEQEIKRLKAELAKKSECHALGGLNCLEGKT